MAERGTPYYDIWMSVNKRFPLYVKNNVLEGEDNEMFLCRVSPFAYLNLNHFISPVYNDMVRKKLYCYEDFEQKISSLIHELKDYDNWRTDSLIKYFHISLLTKIVAKIDFLERYVQAKDLVYSEEVFKLNDYQTYQYANCPPTDYCDLNMFFLKHFPELVPEYRQLALKYHGDDTASSIIYSTLLISYLSEGINDKIRYSKTIEFFNKVLELPNRQDGLAPAGIILGNGSGVISRMRDKGIYLKEFEGLSVYDFIDSV